MDEGGRERGRKREGGRGQAIPKVKDENHSRLNFNHSTERGGDSELDNHAEVRREQ